MLARIPRHSMTYSFAEMIYRVKKQVSAPKTVVIIGDIPEEAKELLAKWSQRQKDIYQVVPYEDGAVMEKWDGDVLLGSILHIPDFSLPLLMNGIFDVIFISIMTLIISTPVAFFAMLGRGYLLPLGYVIVTVILSPPPGMSPTPN